jgi:hypothetical protein
VSAALERSNQRRVTGTPRLHPKDTTDQLNPQPTLLRLDESCYRTVLVMDGD